MIRLTILAAALATAFACGPKEPKPADDPDVAENAEQAEEHAEDAGEALGDAAQSAGEAVGDAAKAVGGAVEGAVEEVGDIINPDGKANGESCNANSDCRSDICEGQGCGDDAMGTCMSRMRPCTADLRPYCGCDGETFEASGTCPNQRYERLGACEEEVAE